jgi:predicted RNase H-like HicB family nuclease
MMSIYPACFFKEEDGYAVVFPDLNYLATSGKSEGEAMAKAVECLAGYLYTSQNDGEQIPEPTAVGDVSIDEVARELQIDVDYSFVNMVSVNVAEYAKMYFEKSVRKTLTIPAWLNEAALAKGINFSQTLRDALIEKVSG